MEQHLYSVLSAAVAFPVAWGTLGSGTETPRAALYRVGGQANRTLDGAGPVEGRVQVDVYGTTYAEAETAAKQVRAALSGYRGGPVQGVFLDAIRDGFEDDANLLQRVSLTFSVIWTE